MITGSAPAGATELDRGGWVPWLTIVPMAALLRLFALLDQLPRQDEWHALSRVSRDGFRGIATTFGVVDHCIPWTLFLEAVDRLVGIDEGIFFLPGAVASLALTLMLPLAGRNILGGTLTWIWAALLAGSPALIDFARTARPYGVAALLAPLAVLCWLRWRGSGSTRAALGYVASTVTVGYSLLPLLPFCLAPFLFPETLRGLRDRASRPALLRVGALAASGLVLLVLPPAVLDSSALGFRVAAAETLSPRLLGLVPLTLLSLYPAWVALAFFALALVGARRASGVKPEGAALVLRQLGIASAVQLAAVLLVRPLGIDNHVVLARYLCPILPVLLLAVAFGLERPARLVVGGVPQFVAAALLTGVMVGNSSVATLFRTPNASGVWWVHGMLPPVAVHFKGSLESRFADRWLTPFYRTLRDFPHASRTIVEAPYSGIHFLPYRHYQQLHRQRVIGGLLPDRCQPESAAIGDGLSRSAVRRFRNLVDALDPVAVRERGGDLILLHSRPWVAERFRPPGGTLPGYDFDRCRARMVEIYGGPSYEDAALSVFDVSR